MGPCKFDQEVVPAIYVVTTDCISLKYLALHANHIDVPGPPVVACRDPDRSPRAFGLGGGSAREPGHLGASPRQDDGLWRRSPLGKKWKAGTFAGGPNHILNIQHPLLRRVASHVSRETLTCVPDVV